MSVDGSLVPCYPLIGAGGGHYMGRKVAIPLALVDGRAWVGAISQPLAQPLNVYSEIVGEFNRRHAQRIGAGGGLRQDILFRALLSTLSDPDKPNASRRTS